MKLLVFADTHNRPGLMLQAVEQEQGAEACFFLGDGAGDTDTLEQLFPQLPVYAVRGNCDFAALDPEEGMAPFGGQLFFYTHGHTFGVKDSLDLLWWTARRRGADVVLFGHTHIPYYEERGGLHLFNPGSIALPRFGQPSYGRITFADGKPNFEIIKMPEKSE